MGLFYCIALVFSSTIHGTGSSTTGAGSTTTGAGAGVSTTGAGGATGAGFGSQQLTFFAHPPSIINAAKEAITKILFLILNPF